VVACAEVGDAQSGHPEAAGEYAEIDDRAVALPQHRVQRVARKAPRRPDDFAAIVDAVCVAEVVPRQRAQICRVLGSAPASLSSGRGAAHAMRHSAFAGARVPWP